MPGKAQGRRGESAVGIIAPDAYLFQNILSLAVWPAAALSGSAHDSTP